jgi:hypothetical protein
VDWSNEDYVKVYTRETDDDLMLSWQALALWRAMLLKFDRSGLLETRRGVRGLAALVRMPAEIVETALPELLEDGRLESVPAGYFARNFLAAQEASKSDRQRQRDSRERRAANARVTNRDHTSRAVTPGHDSSQPVTLTSADPLLPLLPDPVDPDSAESESGKSPTSPSLVLTPEPPLKKPRKQAKRDMPEDWQPTARQRETCRQVGLDLEDQVRRFKNHHAARGNQFASWERAFDTWLDNAPRFANVARAGPQAREPDQPRKIPTLVR